MDLLHRFEVKWQKKWEKAKIFEADPDSTRKKCFVTFPYSYQNGPLHIGHAFTATRVDAYARFKRMNGFNVLFPWAWHWTGQTIAGASERVKKGDQQFIEALKKIDGVTQKELEKFVDPEYMARYYTKENRKTVRKTGFSIDWRREFHTNSPNFSKFIEWQYRKLNAKGYVLKGTHPVVWCPHCESPTGDHDRQEGEGVAPEEYILMKFKLEDSYLPAATFRPETIYGVTNIWINPNAKYVKTKVDEEIWIISKFALKKIKEQKHRIEKITEFKGKELVGKNVTSPIKNQSLIILPAKFVNAENATGIVYSVPAHAPVDWLALRDLQTDQNLQAKYEIDIEKMKKIQPISMIKTKGFSEHPASEIVEKLNVENQCDPKVEEATKIVYKKEFHHGILNKKCGKYAGKRVQEIKDELIEEFKEKKIADIMYDFPEPVVCRCLTPCVVKILKDQWFLKYSDKKWKKTTREALDKIKIFPKTAIPWFTSTIEWLRDWPCARKRGLGTPLPWNKEWIIETLSDSTVYMAYYTINKYKNHIATPAQLTTQVFDYIFYGEGTEKIIAKRSEIPLKILCSMRNEFLYWYPVDMRNSAKELIPNHLTFYLFHHTALFPPEHWPRIIGANGMLMIQGQKMSKSKGNFITFRSAIDKYGADSTRAALLLSAEEMDDPEWKEENTKDVRSKIESFYRLSNSINKDARIKDYGSLEKWLISMIQHKIKIITDSMETLKTRTAFENAFYEIWNDFRWYIRRKGNIKSETVKQVLKIWLKLLSPFIPHICEQNWREIGESNFVSLATWPKHNKTKLDYIAEETENLIRSTLEDTFSIIKATKRKPSRVFYYVPMEWKNKTYEKLTKISMETNERLTTNFFIKEIMKTRDIEEDPKTIVKFVQEITDDINSLGIDRRKKRLQFSGKLNENAILQRSKDFFSRELNAEVQVFTENEKNCYDPKNRGRFARPYRPAIYIEWKTRDATAVTIEY